MSEIGKRVSSSIFYGITERAISMSIAFAGSVVIARLLGPDYYGLVYAMVVIPQTLVSLTDLGLNGAISRYGSRNDWNTAIPAAILRLALVFIMALIIYLLFKDIAFAINRPYIIKYRLPILFYFISYSLATISENITLALALFNINALFRIVRNIIRIGIAITLVFMGYGAVSVVWGLGIGYAIETIALSIISFLKLTNIIKGITSNFKLFINGIKEALRFMAPLLANTAVNYITGPISSVYQMRFANNTLFGNYNASSNIANIFDTISVIINNGLLLGFSTFRSKEELDDAFKKGTAYSVLIIGFLIVGTIVFARTIVHELYGPAYTIAYIMLILQSLNLFVFLLGVYGPYLMAIGDTKLLSLASTIGTIMGFATMLILMPFYSIWGLLISYLIGSYGGNVLLLFLAIRKYKVKPNLETNLRALIPSLLSGSVMYPFTLILGVRFSILLIIPYALLFLALTAIFMNTRELYELNKLVVTDRIMNLVVGWAVRLALRINSRVYGVEVTYG